MSVLVETAGWKPLLGRHRSRPSNGGGEWESSGVWHRGSERVQAAVSKSVRQLLEGGRMLIRQPRGPRLATTMTTNNSMMIVHDRQVHTSTVLAVEKRQQHWISALVFRPYASNPDILSFFRLFFSSFCSCSLKN